MRLGAAEAESRTGPWARAVTAGSLTGSLLREFVEDGYDVAQQRTLFGGQLGQPLGEPGVARAPLGLEQFETLLGDGNDGLPLVLRVRVAAYQTALLEGREHLR